MRPVPAFLVGHAIEQWPIEKTRPHRAMYARPASELPGGRFGFDASTVLGGFHRNAATRCQEFRSDRTLDHLLSHGSEARFSSIAVTSKRKVRTLEGQAGRSSQVLLLQRDLELCVQSRDGDGMLSPPFP
jgi:hypothetical protein